MSDARASTDVQIARPGQPAPEPEVPSAAQQYRQTAADLADFASFARTAEDPDIAARAERLERHTHEVLTDLSPEADDDEAQRIVEPMFTESIGLYYDCAAHIIEQGPGEDAPGERHVGACERPGAPTLDGPNVVHYGSGQEFIESTCELRDGVRIDNGCSFPGHGTTTSGEDGHLAHASVEVAYDPDTCQALYETGPVRPGTLP